MRTRSRVTAPALLAATLLLGGAGVARAGGEAGGDITFRLILRGDVIEGDNFSLAVNDLGPTGLIISPGIRCGPDSQGDMPQGVVACQPGTYDFVLPGMDELPVGTPLEYVWARNYGGEADRRADIIYRDTITITESAQVFTVVYEYPGGSMPDTAVGAPVKGDLLSTITVLVGLLVLTFAALVRVRTWRCHSPTPPGSP